MIERLKAALAALEESRDDVNECLNGLEHGKGYPKYDRRISAYTEQLVKHDQSIADLRSVIAEMEAGEQPCFCDEHVSLQMVSGGGAPEGYLGKVTLRIGDQYRDYYTHPQPKAEPALPKLIGWRTSDYLMETADPAMAKNWELHYEMLPIFEGDANTKLQPKAEPVRQPKKGDRVICVEDEDIGTVKFLYSNGSPYIEFDSGAYGDWSLEEFGKLFRYVEPKAEP